MKKSVLKNFAIFTGKHLRWSFFFNKVTCPQACNFIKKRLPHSCCPLNIAKFLRTPILRNICGRLLLKVLLAIFQHMHKRVNLDTDNFKLIHLLTIGVFHVLSPFPLSIPPENFRKSLFSDVFCGYNHGM